MGHNKRSYNTTNVATLIINMGRVVDGQNLDRVRTVRVSMISDMILNVAPRNVMCKMAAILNVAPEDVTMPAVVAWNITHLADEIADKIAS